MTPFLKQVARHYCAQGHPESLCFIFPNRRALLFFKKHFREEVAQKRTPVIAPEFLTINEFFYSLSGAGATDRVNLLLTLYDCYKELNPKAESLDDFIFWGDVILADFDDVDKYLVNPAHIFRNVAEFKEIQDSFEYLTEEQKIAVENFLGHFSSGGSIKEEFLRLWEILLPLYNSFNSRLREKGLSYEGEVYRLTAEREESITDSLSGSFPDRSKFIFVGLNALSSCERAVMRKMRNAGVAEFCWDYSGKWIKDPDNRSSKFLSELTVDFPQAFEPEDECIDTNFRAISVPSAVAQAKLLPMLLREKGIPGIETAVILPDENLLIPTLNSIPEEIRELNVTMGYPMSGSALWTLMDDVASLQSHVRIKDDRPYFYHKQVFSILSSSIIRSVADESSREIIAGIRKAARYYIAEDELRGTPLLDLIFRSIPEGDIPAMESYQQSLVSGLAVLLKGKPDMAIELDFAREFYLAVGRLKTYSLPVKTATYFRLLSRLLSGAAIPFKGEPLSGLQIMGPLETRALDFENIIILGCNEGTFPRRSVSSSFIPPELRRGFNLPTYEYQDAVWAYYFYRLIHRASSVTFVYDSRTEGVRVGEESRYIKQLELHFGAKVKRCVISSEIKTGSETESIPKTEGHISRLLEGHLSASALQNYLCCPAKFFYGTVCGLRPEDEASEALDAGGIGTVFHESMEIIFKNAGSKVTSEYLKKVRSDSEGIKRIVCERIKDVQKTFEISGKNIIYEDIVCRYVRQVLSRDIEMLESLGRPYIFVPRIKTNGRTEPGIELHVSREIDGFKFVGTIDRLDCVEPGTFRIVDYKTGYVTDDDFNIDEANAEEVVRKLFDPDTESKERPKIALQMYLYDLFARDLEECRGSRIVNSIYQTSRLFKTGIEQREICGKFSSLMKEALSKCLEEMKDTSVPWTRNTGNCENCDFKNICGR